MSDLQVTDLGLCVLDRPGESPHEELNVGVGVRVPVLVVRAGNASNDRVPSGLDPLDGRTGSSCDLLEPTGRKRGVVAADLAKRRLRERNLVSDVREALAAGHCGGSDALLKRRERVS